MATTDDFLKVFSKGVKKSAKKKVFPLRLKPNAPLREKTTGGDIGIELEIEGRNLPRGPAVRGGPKMAPKSGALWTVHDDGSLRGESAEYVLSTPVFKEEVKPCLDHIWGKLSNDVTEVIPSNRTSTHVHINAQGLRLNQFVSWIVLWTMYEEAMVSVCGEERKSNHFCLTNLETDGWLVESVFSHLSKGKTSWSRDTKYSSLNLGAFTTFGSLEFRSMGTMQSVEQVLDWAFALYGLREKASSRPFNDPSRIPALVSEMGAANLFREICLENGVSEAFVEKVFGSYNNDEAAFNAVCLEGLRDAQRLCYLIDWTEWLPDIEKAYVKDPFASKKALRG